MMLSARSAQKSCPQCRLQLLTLFENCFVGSRPVSRLFPQPRYSSLAALRTTQRSSSRLLSTTRPNLHDGQPESHSPSEPQLPPETEAPGPDDIETIVRQARQAFGDTLPKDYLNQEEYELYERLYGAPLRATRPEDVGMSIPPQRGERTELDPSERMLLCENENGEIEEVVYQLDELPTPDSAATGEDQQATTDDGNELVPEELPSEAGMMYVQATAKSEREFNALLKLQMDFEKANVRAAPEEDIEEEEPLGEEEEDEYQDEEQWDERQPPEIEYDQPSQRAHPYTSAGRWGTQPSTVFLPKTDFVDPITKLLDRTDTKHIKEAAEKAFGGHGLPHSVATPSLKGNMGQLAIPIEAGHHKVNEINADAYMATNFPGMYATTMSILVEIRKRLGQDWISKLMSRGSGQGPRVLDVGAGGAALAAWQEVLQAEWDLAADRGETKSLEPPGKKTVVVGSEALRFRVSRFLQNTTFLPRLPDYLHSGYDPDHLESGDKPLPRKSFDIIIASHTMMPVKDAFKRKELLENLWELLSPEGGILVVVEKGHPRGFEAVADVRARLLNDFIVSPSSNPRPESVEPEQQRKREPGMVIAPCTNQKQCPMYLTPGMSPGRKDFCHFSQRFIRPPFLQKVLSKKHRNHEDIDFSFVAIQRGTLPGAEVNLPKQDESLTQVAFEGYEESEEAPHPLSLPRSVLPALKKRGHVTMDLCTPAGTIERWTVPKSFSKQAYRDARKTRWGDLWALGAKTRVVRPVRLGRGGAVTNDGGVRARQAVQGIKPRVIHLNADSGGIYSAGERFLRHGPAPRRTKGGKKWKLPDHMAELTKQKQKQDQDDDVD
ncbi:Rsm22-domain-containing protein [Xylariomycetidae sp. FL2044]|nr:Rsm22-domain-containing protein [Xylariomycetidae sp. FL2044]